MQGFSISLHSSDSMHSQNREEKKMTAKKAASLFKIHARAKGYYNKVKGFNSYKNVQDNMMTLIGYSEKSIRISVDNQHFDIFLS